MKATRITICLLAGAMGLAGCASEGLARRSGAAPVEPAVPRLSKEDVITLTAAKVSDRVIISQIQASGSRFALATQDLVDLTNAGVSGSVVEAMVKTSGTPPDAEVATQRARDGYYGPVYWRAVSPPPWYYPSVYYPWYPWYPGGSLDFTIAGAPRTRVWYPRLHHAVAVVPRESHGDRGYHGDRGERRGR